MPRCVYCGKPLWGSYLRDDLGRCAHEEHAHLCLSCMGFIGSDGRQIGRSHYQCEACRKFEVREARHVEWVRRQVLTMLAAHGINDLPPDVPIEVVPPARLAQLLEVPIEAVRDNRGLTVTGASSSLFRTRYSHTIYVLGHLHRVPFAGVLAHEYLHVWQNEHRLSPPPQVCEGFCNLGSWLVYRQIATDLAAAMMRNLEKSPDPVYGDGFRRVKAVYDTVPGGDLPATMRRLKSGR